MSYILKHDLPGLRKGAKLLFDKIHNMYYAPKDNYADYYWFSKSEVENGRYWFKIKKFFCVLIFVFSGEVNYCQSANWTTVNEKSIDHYEVQQSKDGVTWASVLPSVAKGKTSYTYPVPLVTMYWRIKAVGVTPFYTAAQLLSIGTTVYTSTISSAKISTSWWTDKLTWTTTKESNVNFYRLEKSTGTWSQLTTIPAKGNSNYSYTNSRGWFSRKPSYRVSAVYKNGTSGAITNF